MCVTWLLRTHGENEPDGLNRSANGIDQSGERLGVHRDGTYEDSMCGVRAALEKSLRDSFTHALHKIRPKATQEPTI